jgi:catechol 2,3-dioxygenase-like lactoylglutathione lyase family enzyme
MPGTLQQLRYVILLCDDLAGTRAFYHEVLGLPVHRDGDGWVELQAANVLLALRPRGRSYDGPRSSPGAGVQLAFCVAPDEVADWWHALAARGVEILTPPQDHAYGHRTLFVRDREGNVVEVYAEIEVQ